MSHISGPAKQNPVYDWVRGSFDQGGRKKWGLPSPPILPPGHALPSPPTQGAESGEEAGIPYAAMLKELNQTKHQLQELYNLVGQLSLTQISNRASMPF